MQDASELAEAGLSREHAAQRTFRKLALGLSYLKVTDSALTTFLQ